MKQRLDAALVARKLVSGRDRAKALIMAGQVYVNGQKSDKAGEEVREDDRIEVRGETLRYVSRGGLKLEKALAAFPISLEGKTCCDFGASTGGFTDCMLQNGAAKVYAFDVGYGQLAWSLRNDPRVVNYERTNIRYLTGEEVDGPVDFISVDVSFISLTLILPVAYRLLAGGGEIVCLIKPQFEAGRDKIGKKGVVRDPAVHLEVIEKVLGFVKPLSLSVKGITYSPVKGPEGNIEYLLYLKKDAEPVCEVTDADAAEAVRAAHAALDRREG